MSVAEIKSALKEIKKLPPKKRAEVSGWVLKELAPENIAVRTKLAYKAGKLNGLIQRAEAAYAAGKALDRIY